MTKDELIKKECETWACWGDLEESEQDEVIEGYGKIYNAGYKIKEEELEMQADRVKELCDEKAKLELEIEEMRDIRNMMSIRISELEGVDTR